MRRKRASAGPALCTHVVSLLFMICRPRSLAGPQLTKTPLAVRLQFPALKKDDGQIKSNNKTFVQLAHLPGISFSKELFNLLSS